MQENVLTVQIKTSLEELFNYTTRPWNTHLWIDEVVAEDCSPWPPQVGVSHYRNKGHDGVWTDYKLVAYEPNALFELAKIDGSFGVRYTYADLGEGKVELTYREWVNEGEITCPFGQDALDKLKRMMEAV